MARPPRWAIPLLVVLLLAGFAAGIWGSYRAVFPAKGLYRVTGTFETRWGETMIQVNLAESKELLDRAALRPGDRVRFTIRSLPDKLLVVEIQTIR